MPRVSKTFFAISEVTPAASAARPNAFFASSASATARSAGVPGGPTKNLLTAFGGPVTAPTAPAAIAPPSPPFLNPSLTSLHQLPNIPLPLSFRFFVFFFAFCYFFLASFWQKFCKKE